MLTRFITRYWDTQGMNSSFTVSFNSSTWQKRWWFYAPTTTKCKSQSGCVRLRYLLCHVGLRQVVKDESNLLLDIVWRLNNPFCLVSGHQQGVNVGCVYRGLEARWKQMKPKRILSSLAIQHEKSNCAFSITPCIPPSDRSIFITFLLGSAWIWDKDALY